ncbi:MAG: outer membrane beta-barrel protein [Acidobacteria bacterium]|nr:outer membrane beta-barrel protein [Acidobacteriota bacterium]MBV9477190.1 outer membrane beta-barrel protein [Acidobacteriota bacterium]
MKKTLLLSALLAAFTFPAAAQDWSLGIHTGPFVFGDFVERRIRLVGGDQSTPATKVTLSAKTRAGLSVDLQHAFADRWAVRAEGTFTHAPLAIKQSDSDGIALDAGNLDVTTISVPLVFRINPHGTFRFHLMGGPAYAMYHANGRTNAAGNVSVFEGTRSNWGLMFGGGVSWNFSDHFALEGNLSDVATASPFHREDFPDVPGFSIPRPHNVHTTVGLRWAF